MAYQDLKSGHGKRPTGGGRCSLCGSKAWRIEWDASHRAWFCALQVETRDRAKPRKHPKAAPVEEEPAVPEAEPDARAVVCGKCGTELLSRALPGVTAYCKRCRRWSGEEASTR